VSAPRWWERWPGRRELEIHELAAAGYEPVAEEIRGRLHVRVLAPFMGSREPILITYPDLFPYFRPEFYASRDLRLRKHQNPLAGNLCLLDRSTSAWVPTDTAAEVLEEQLPRLEAAIRTEGTSPQLEAQQAEPVTTYYSGMTAPESVVLMPPEAYSLEPGTSGGILRLAYAAPKAPPLRGVVVSINGVPVTLMARLGSAFPRAGEVDVEWIRLETAPIADSVAELASALEADGRIGPARRIPGGKNQITALAIPEEVEYGGATEIGWLFLVRTRNQSWLVGTERADAREQATRLRDIIPLSARRILLVGLGAVGAPAAHLLLQSRVAELRIVDGDIVSAGNAVRWPLGFGAIGYPKVEAFASFAREQYPETRVDPVVWRIGQSVDPSTEDEARIAGATLAGIDVIFDATAEHGVQQYLADSARLLNVPYVMVEAREGAYGGLVARFRPGGPCWYCLKAHQMEGKFLPPFDDVGTVQPKGCASPTFTGASFDLVPLSAMAVRLLTQTIAANDRYPDADWDIGVLSNRVDGTGTMAMVPRWDLAALTPHQRCPVHGPARQAA
jgi:molybdopterin/thiamine biosynthesis adenylyltransferase